MRIKRMTRTIWTLGVILALLLPLLAACGSSDESDAVAPDKINRAVAQAPADAAEEKVVEREIVVETVVETVVEVEVLSAEVPSPDEGESVGPDALAAGPVADFKPQASERLIIKDALLDLAVEDVDRAVDGVTQVVGHMQGYIISHRVWYQEQYKYATVTIGVPVQTFEDALNRLRALAAQVLNETASGEDVTDQFVDLQSRLRNLQATRDRILSFMDDTKTIAESLEINQQLSDMEDQIEQVQGRINYLRGRAAYSTITINLNPIIPTPTPAPTATPTPTPTPTPTLTPTPTATPDVWRPGETAKDALGVTAFVGMSLVELLIWFVIVALPWLLIFRLLYWASRKLGWRMQRKQVAAPIPPPDEAPASDED